MNKNRELNQIKSFPWLLVVFFLMLFLGAIVGINLSDGVACSQQDAMCQNFRFKQPKVDYQK